MWGRQVYRWSDLDFEANGEGGIGVDWPVRYRDIEPWYYYVERFIGISGQLGRNVMDHIFEAGATGVIPGYERERTFGNRPNGIYVARFRNLKERHPKFLRGYGFQGGASRAGWGRGAGTAGFGAEFKRQLIGDLGPWTMWLGGWGECLPRPDNWWSWTPR